MALLVRTWNVFHGNATPPEREAYLEKMVRLASADRPDVLCLQELPVWALEQLDDWSGMAAIGDVAARPSFGPLPLQVEVGRRLTGLHHGLFRSAFSGQANAILLGGGIVLQERHVIVLNPHSFRRLQGRALGLDPVVRLAWAKERRICQAVRVALAEGGTAVVANLHASKSADERVPDAELLRAAVFADAIARPDVVLVLAGDFNVTRDRSRTLAKLTQPEWGFTEPGAGIDHVLVRGGAAGLPEPWPPDRRRLDGRLLSDHAPVEIVVG